VGADGATGGNGIYLSNAQSVSLASMRLDNHPNHAIRGVGVTGFALATSLVDGANGSNDSLDEGSLSLLNARGTYAITSSDISGGLEDNLLIRHDSTATGSAAFTISDSIFRDNNATLGNAGIQWSSASASTAAVTLTVTGTTDTCQFTNNRGDGIQVVVNGTAQHTLSVSNCRFSGNFQALDIASDLSADLTYTIDGNLALNHEHHVIAYSTLANSTSSSAITGLIKNNTIGNGTVDSGSRSARGISLDLRSAEAAQITIHDNSIANTDLEGMFVDTRIGIGSLHLQVTDNTIATPDDNSTVPLGLIHGLVVTSRDSRTMCLDMRDNDSAHVGSGFDIRVRQSVSAVFQLEGFTGDGTSDTAVADFLVTQNPGNTTEVQTTGSGTVVNYTGGTCTTPSP
jgi:hypothetical protein